MALTFSQGGQNELRKDPALKQDRGANSPTRAGCAVCRH